MVFFAIGTYTDQELDHGTGLYNYDARLYDPVIGMFITPDSILPDVYDPQMLNRYAYCRNNPLIYVDPTGHSNEAAMQMGTDPRFWMAVEAGLLWGGEALVAAASTPAVLLTAAGAAGYGVGTLINNYAVDPLVDSLWNENSSGGGNNNASSLSGFGTTLTPDPNNDNDKPSNTYKVTDPSKSDWNVQTTIKDSVNYPKGFEPLKNGTMRENVNNNYRLDSLRKIKGGQWKHVYKNGTVKGNKVSIHYFEHSKNNNIVTGVKVKPGWSWRL